VPLMDMGFVVISQLARHRMPLIRFLYIGSYVCSTLLSDPPSPERPCASLSLHLHQVVKRTFTFEPSNMLGTLKPGRWPPACVEPVIIPALLKPWKNVDGFSRKRLDWETVENCHRAADGRSISPRANLRFSNT